MAAALLMPDYRNGGAERPEAALDAL